MVFQYETARLLSQEAARQGKTARVHLGVDTGMSRIGVKDDETGASVAESISALPNLEIEGVFTHFARADERDKTAANRQLQRFSALSGAAGGTGSLDSPSPLLQQRRDFGTARGKSGRGSGGALRFTEFIPRMRLEERWGFLL